MTGIMAAVILIAASPSAFAIFVGATPNVLPNTSGKPDFHDPNNSNTDWGDPGWDNEARTYPYYFNGVYIGDGWFLTANHANLTSLAFTEGGATYNVIPKPGDQNFPYQSYQVPNPANGDPQLSQPLSDLRLYRINADPGLPSLTIASNPLGLNDQVVFISTGLLRASAETHWNVSGKTWTTVTSGGTQSGYVPDGVGKRWGTNNVANDSYLGDDIGNDPQGTTCSPSNPSHQCDASDANITTNVNHGTIANIAIFDRYSSNPYETQVVGGDSGSPVFHYNTTTHRWELAGITLATYTYDGQDSTWGVYGDASAFADLSSYRSNILAIMSAHQDYSIAGDLDLDGVAGTPADIAAFVNGWGFNNGTGQGTMASWKLGDLNHDGKTNVADFLKFRSGLSAGAGASLDAMMSRLVGGEVPEPSTMFLAVGSAIFFALCGRKRRSQFSV